MTCGGMRARLRTSVLRYPRIFSAFLQHEGAVRVKREHDLKKRKTTATTTKNRKGHKAGVGTRPGAPPRHPGRTPRAIGRDLSEAVPSGRGLGTERSSGLHPPARVEGASPWGKRDREKEGQEERGHLLDHTLLVHDVGLEAQHGEHHEGGQHRGEEVDEGHQGGVEVAVVVLLVVAGEGDDAPEAQPQGEEDLGGRLPPHLGVQHLVQLGRGRGRGGGDTQTKALLTCSDSPSTPPGAPSRAPEAVWLWGRGLWLSDLGNSPKPLSLTSPERTTQITRISGTWSSRRG